MAGHTYQYRDRYGDEKRNRDDREKKVHELVAWYEVLREPSAALRHIHSDPDLCRLFCEIVEQQIKLIKSRRQEFDDGHITVFDKALKELSYNGSTASNLGVQELYIREYIGINPEAPSPDFEETLAKTILIKDFLEKFSVASLKKSSSPAETETPRETSMADPPFSHTDTETYSIFNQDPIVKKEDPNVKNHTEALLKLYFDAKKDFYNLKSENYEENAVAAKYLRDTAENALLYLKKDDLGCDALLHELQTVFEYSRGKSVAFLGGKKRRFEVEKVPRGGSRRQHNRASFRHSPYSRDRGWFASEARYYH